MEIEPISLWKLGEAVSAKSVRVKIITQMELLKSTTFQIIESLTKYSLP